MVAIVCLAAGFLASCKLTGVASIGAGSGHTCQVGVAGDVRCWGGNLYGQLGDGTTIGRLEPVTVTGLDDIVEVAAGQLHTCALRVGGQVLCWGDNAYGSLGNGTFSSSLVPVPVAGITTALDITSGDSFSCARLLAGTVQCWGRNDVGQLGDSTTVNRGTPVDTAGAMTGVSKIDAGGSHACALINDTTARCWGVNGSGQVGDGTSGTDRLQPVTVTGVVGATEISAGEFHSCAIITGGTAKCWGHSFNGEVGNGLAAPADYPTAQDVQALSGATQISAGGEHTCALVAGGAVWCWGNDIVFEMGVAPPPGYTFWPEAAPSGFTGATQVSAGYGHTCALLADETVQCAGDNSNGQNGNGTDFLTFDPAAVGYTIAAEGMNMLAAGGGSACVSNAAGSMLCWGSNQSDQLGNGDAPSVSGYDYSPLATSVIGVTGAANVATGSGHSCAVVTGGAVQCWGSNTFGQLGDGTTTHHATAVAVVGISSALQVAVGDAHTCALLAGWSVKCWGKGTLGQLGNGAALDSSVPVTAGLSDAIEVTAGTNHSCARIRTTGAVTCWGANTSGQLGDGTTTNALTPVPATGLSSGAARVDAGASYSCAALTSGSARCWGANGSGQLGDGTKVARLVPTAVSGLTTATEVTAGNTHSCARLADGSARCWGRNTDGQMGDGTVVNRLTPVTVSSLTGATRVSVGATQSCALIAAGAVRCWGGNAAGAVGNGIDASQLLPVAVRVRPF